MFKDMIAVLEVKLLALVRTQHSDFLPCGNEKSLSVIARYRIIKFFLSMFDDRFFLSGTTVYHMVFYSAACWHSLILHLFLSCFSCIVRGKSRNGWIWKAPLHVILSNHTAQAEPLGVICLSQCSNNFRICQWREMPQPLWVACASAQSPSQYISVSWCWERTSCVSIFVYCLLSCCWV